MDNPYGIWVEEDSLKELIKNGGYWWNDDSKRIFCTKYFGVAMAQLEYILEYEVKESMQPCYFTIKKFKENGDPE